MPQIPLYNRSATQTPEAPGAPVSSEAMEAPYRALSSLGGAVTQLGVEFDKKMRAEEDEASIAKYKADRKLRANAISQTISVMDNPDDIQEAYTSWREEEDRILASTELNERAKNNIINSNQMFYADMDIGASGMVRKAKVENVDRSWIDVQGLALNNETDPTVLNEDGTVMSPEQLYKYATMKRVGLGTVKYEEADKLIRGFGQNLQLRQIVAASDNDVEEADKMLKDSTLSGEKLVIASDAVRDAREKRDYTIKEEHRQNTDRLNREVQSRSMTRERLRKLSNETINIMGKEVPAVPDSIITANRSALDASEDFDVVSQPTLVNNISGFINKVTNAGKFDLGQSEVDKLYKEIAIFGRSGASRVSVESMLNIANTATTQYAEGRGWSEQTVEQINYITDAYTTQYANAPARYKDVDEVTGIISKIDGFIKDVVKPADGKPTDAAIKEWSDANMSTINQQNAIDKYRQTYRIGEQKIEEGKVQSYKGNGVWEVVD